MSNDTTPQADPVFNPDDIPAPNPRNVKLLKTVVAVLGVLLVLGTIVLIGAIVYRAAKLKSAPPVQGFKLESKLPEGSTVKSTDLNGDRMAVRIQTADGEQIILFNIKKGTEIGRIDLK